MKGMIFINREEIIKHRKALFEKEKVFDKDKGLISSGVVKAHAYHTKLIGQEVHGTRDSLGYAVGLLYGEDEEYTKRAIEIIEKMLKLQDTDPESRTFGLWPYYAEEPLDEMDAPDWNWADFLGKQLLEILYVHKNKIPDELITDIESACGYACESVIRRNEGVQYTNVVFMECLLLIATGETLKNKRYFDYGIDKLERFLGFYKFHGAVFEYNSPCYTPLITRDVGTFLKLVKDERAKKMAEMVNDICWKMIAEHFRYDMMQLAGPHSRAYTDMLSDDVLYGIELACEGEVSFDFEKKDDIETFWTKPYCPPKYRKYFRGEVLPKSTEKLIMRGFNYPYFAFAQTATTYHDERFTLGTFNREELWNQRRPLLGYIKGEHSPYCVRVRCLHDGYDFSSAVLHCVQKEGNVLGNINFSRDRGDTHIGLDLVKDTTIEAEDLRIIFEVVGDAEKINYKVNDESVEINIGNVPVKITHICTHFGDYPITHTTEKTDEYFRYSIVLYSGEKKKINFGAMEKVISAFFIEMGKISKSSKIKAEFDGDYLKTVWETGGDSLELHTLKSVHPFKVNMYEDKQYINGEELFTYLDSIEIQK